MSKVVSVKTERVDDIPLLFAELKRMGVAKSGILKRVDHRSFLACFLAIAKNNTTTTAIGC